MYDHGMIGPVLALVGWTFVMWIWLYAARIPAMQKAKLDPQEAERTGNWTLPRSAERPAENYNHLHEQPTIFYAMALAAQLAGPVDSLSIGLAWTYVAIRVVHSLIQATANIIMVRFLVFTIGTLVLLTLFVRIVMDLFGFGLG